MKGVPERIEREPLVLHQLLSCLPSHLDPSEAHLELSGLDRCAVRVEPNGRSFVSGAIRLANTGDGFGITADLMSWEYHCIGFGD